MVWVSGLLAAPENLPCCSCHSWNLAVSNGSNPVHLAGHPISDSRYGGFSGPRSPYERDSLGFPLSAPLMWCALVFEAVGVGSNPDALTFVGSSGMVSSEHSPSHIEPHRGQVSEYGSKPPRSEHWRVFHEDESRLNFATIRAISIQSPLLAPSRPAPLPAALMSWQGKPPETTSIAPRHGSPSKVRTSSQIGKGGSVPSFCRASKTLLDITSVGLDGADGSPTEQPLPSIPPPAPAKSANSFMFPLVRFYQLIRVLIVRRNIMLSTTYSGYPMVLSPNHHRQCPVPFHFSAIARNLAG